MCFAVYSNSLGNGFQRDDLPHIVNNAAIRELSSFPRLFSRDYFQLNGAVAYRPVVVALRMLEYKAFGLDARLWRLFDLLLHAVNAALLCWVILAVSGLPGAAAAAGVLFLLHPAQTEALNYVSNGQCDILCLFFLLVSFLAYLNEKRFFSLAAFSLALLSKEMALAFPLLLLVYAYYYGDLRKDWKTPALGAGLSLVFLLWRLFYFKAGPGFIDKVPSQGAFGFTLAGAAAAVVKFPVLVVYYLKLLVWPAALSVEIDRILPAAGLFSGPHIALAWLFLAALAGAVYFYAKNKIYAFSLISFILALLPVSGLVPLTSVLQEHFVYIPSVFFCLLAGLGFAKAWSRAAWRKISVPVLALLLLASAGRIWARNADWRTPLTLAEADVRAFPGSSSALAGLASAKSAAGDYAGALDLCLKAEAAGPPDGEVYFLAAEIYLRSGAREKALASARLGLEMDLNSPDARVNIARIYARAGMPDEALAAAREAAALFPYFEPAYLTLGEILLLEKRPAEAERMFAEALRLNSRSAAAKRLADLRRPVPYSGKTK